MCGLNVAERLSVIFRLGEQEEYLFPVFPSPRKLGYVNEEKYSNP